jgi:hypothetical protein
MEKLSQSCGANIQPSTKLSVLCGLFSIYGYATLKKELASVSEARLIISRWDDSYLQALSGQSSEMRLKNHLDQSRIAKECAVWLQKQAQIKALLGVGAGQNLFHLANQNSEAFGIQGSSNFTAAGLGETKSDVLEMNLGVRWSHLFGQGSGLAKLFILLSVGYAANVSVRIFPVSG